MATELGDPSLKSNYDALSQHTHWTIKGIAEHLDRSGGAVNINFDQKYNAAMASAVRFMALTGTFQLLATHFSLALLDEIERLIANYKAELSVP